MPVDRIAEGQAAIAEQVEAAGEHGFRLADERRLRPRHAAAQRAGHVWAHRALEESRRRRLEESLRGAGRPRRRDRRRAPAREPRRAPHPERARPARPRARVAALPSSPRPVESLAQLLHAPPRDLRRPHAEEPGRCITSAPPLRRPRPSARGPAATYTTAMACRARRAMPHRRVGIVEQRDDGARHGGGIPLRHEDPCRRPRASRRSRPSAWTPRAAPRRAPRGPRSADCRPASELTKMSASSASARHARRLDAPGEAHGPLDAQRGREPPQGLVLAAVARHGQRRLRVSALEQRQGPERVGHVVARLEVARRQEARPERHPIAVAKGASVHHVRDHPRAVAPSARRRRADTATARRSRRPSSATDGRAGPSARDGRRPRRCGS